MNKMIQIGETEIPVVEYQGKRVVSFAMIDAVHHRAEGTARKRFNDNQSRLVKNEDYMKIGSSEVRTDLWNSFGFSKFAPSGILLTQSGYMMLVKSFTDDLAWTVQKQLVNRYFQHESISSSTEIKDPALAAIHTTLVELDKVKQEQSRLKNELSKIEKRQDNMDGDTGYVTVLGFCRREGIPASAAFARKLGKLAAKRCKSRAIPIGKVSDERWGTVNSYPVDVLRECLKEINSTSKDVH